MRGSVAKSVLSRYLGFSPRDARADREKGRRDGERNFPPPGRDDYSPHELERIGQARAALTGYFRELHRAVSDMEQDILKKEQTRDQGYFSHKEALVRDKEAALEHLRAADGLESAVQRQLREAAEEKTAAWRKVELTLNRPLRIHFRRPYFWLLGALAVAEVPVNRLAFEYFFQESPLISLLLALTVGVLFMALAHVSAMSLRQSGRYEQRGQRAVVYAGNLLALGAAGSLMYFISALRQQVVDFLSAEQQHSLAAQLLQGGVGEVLTRTFSTDLGVAGVTLLTLNAAIFLLGYLLSYFRHDPSPDYERALREREKAAAALFRHQQQFERKLALTAAGFDEKITWLDRKTDEVELELQQLQNEIAVLEEQKQHDIALVLDVLKQQLLAYQTANMETRTEPQPVYFGDRLLVGLRRRVLQE